MMCYYLNVHFQGQRVKQKIAHTRLEFNFIVLVQKRPGADEGFWPVRSFCFMRTVWSVSRYGPTFFLAVLWWL